MQDLIGNVELNVDQAQYLLHGLYTLSTADGVHEAELALMQEFYEGLREDGVFTGTWNDWVKKAQSVKWSAESAKQYLSSPEVQAVFMKACFFLSFSDGVLSEAEKTTLRSLATDIEVSEEDFRLYYDLTKDILMQSLGHIQNLDALRQLNQALAL